MSNILRAILTRSATYAAALAGCDTVVHLAAVTGKSRPETYFQVNREGTRALIGECKHAGTKRLLYISTIAAKFTNQHRYYYAQSKRQAEEAVSRGGLTLYDCAAYDGAGQRVTRTGGPGAPGKVAGGAGLW